MHGLQLLEVLGPVRYLDLGSDLHKCTGAGNELLTRDGVRFQGQELVQILADVEVAPLDLDVGPEPLTTNSRAPLPSMATSRGGVIRWSMRVQDAFLSQSKNWHSTRWVKSNTVSVPYPAKQVSSRMN